MRVRACVRVCVYYFEELQQSINEFKKKSIFLKLIQNDFFFLVAQIKLDDFLFSPATHHSSTSKRSFRSLATKMQINVKPATPQDHALKIKQRGITHVSPSSSSSSS